MATVRCYLPLTPRQVRTLLQERRLGGPLPAYAVTPAVEAAHAGGDLEEWEFAALQEAARSQLAGDAPVIVAAADVAEEGVLRREDEAAGARVEVGDVDLPRVAALHLGDDVVTGRRGAVVEDHQGIELSWYDTTEISHVVELAEALDGTPAGG